MIESSQPIGFRRRSSRFEQKSEMSLKTATNHGLGVELHVQADTVDLDVDKQFPRNPSKVSVDRMNEDLGLVFFCAAVTIIFVDLLLVLSI
jgi:hypothetical protein